MQALLGVLSCPVGQVHLAAMDASCRKNVESNMHISFEMTLQLKHRCMQILTLLFAWGGCLVLHERHACVDDARSISTSH